MFSLSEKAKRKCQLHSSIWIVHASWMHRLHWKKNNRTLSEQTWSKSKDSCWLSPMQRRRLVSSDHTFRHFIAIAQPIKKRTHCWDWKNQRTIWRISLLRLPWKLLVHWSVKMDGPLSTLWRQILYCLLEWRPR